MFLTKIKLIMARGEKIFNYANVNIWITFKRVIAKNPNLSQI